MLAPSNSPWLEPNTHTTMLTGFTPRLWPWTSTELSAVVGNPLQFIVSSPSDFPTPPLLSETFNTYFTFTFNCWLCIITEDIKIIRRESPSISFAKPNDLPSVDALSLHICISFPPALALEELCYCSPPMSVGSLSSAPYKHYITYTSYICEICSLTFFFSPLDPLLSVPSHFCVLVYGEPSGSTAYGWCHHFPFSGGPTSNQGPCCTTPLKPPLARHR